jgi:hypothetical protein
VDKGDVAACRDAAYRLTASLTLARAGDCRHLQVLRLRPETRDDLPCLQRHERWPAPPLGGESKVALSRKSEEQPVHEGVEVNVLDLVRSDLVSGADAPVVVQVAVELQARVESLYILALL